MPSSARKKTTLVTGASGFIGSHLVDELCRRGYRVRCFIRPTSSMEWLAGRDVEIVRGTFESYDSLYPAVKSVDYVYHIGGAVRSIYPEDFNRINGQGTRNVAKAVQEFTPDVERFIYISSLSAGGATQKLSSPLTEDDSPAPVSVYGQSKLSGEVLLREEFSDLPVTVVRPPLVFGPRDRNTFMVIGMMQWRFCPTPLRLHAISVIYVKDLVRGIADAAETSEAEGKTYYLANSQPYPLNTFINEVIKHLATAPAFITIPYSLGWISAYIFELYARITRKPVLFERQKLREAVQKYWICSPAAAKADFNFTCHYTLEAAMLETMDWYRNQGWLR
jgi:dihydroflavonol-4-reductase